MDDTIRRKNVRLDDLRVADSESLPSEVELQFGALNSRDVTRRSDFPEVIPENRSLNGMIQKSGFESGWVFQKGVNSIRTKSFKCIVGWGENGQIVFGLLQCTNQIRGFDKYSERAEATVTQHSGVQVLRRKKNGIDQMNDTIVGRNVEFCDIRAIVDDDAATRSNTEEHVVIVCSVDYTRLHVFLKKAAI
jgi:hypothetical protein